MYCNKDIKTMQQDHVMRTLKLCCMVKYGYRSCKYSQEGKDLTTNFIVL